MVELALVSIIAAALYVKEFARAPVLLPGAASVSSFCSDCASTEICAGQVVMIANLTYPVPSQEVKAFPHCEVLDQFLCCVV